MIRVYCGLVSLADFEYRSMLAQVYGNGASGVGRMEYGHVAWRMSIFLEIMAASSGVAMWGVSVGVLR